jgi:hypothetical protein
MLKRRLHLKKATCLLLVCCSSIFIYPGCRKPELEKSTASNMEAMNGEAPVTIKLSEIYQKLPQTTLYAAAAKLNFYTGRAEWAKSDSNLTIRIPLDNTGNDYIYAVKENLNPGEVKVYIVSLEYADGITEADFTGKKWWLDLQDWRYYAVEYEHNIAIKGITPEIIAEPGWEQCMLEEGVFDINDQGEMNIIRNPLRCPPNPNRNGSSFWRSIKDFFESLGNDGSDGGSAGSGSAGGGIGQGSTGYVFTGPMNGSFNNGPGFPGNNGLGGGGSWNSNPSGTAGVFTIDEVENNGLVSPNVTPIVTFVKNLLNLNVTRTDYITMHPEVASSVMNYLLTPASSIGNISVAQRNANAVEHIDAMNLMPDYYNDITAYISNPTHHWWDIDVNSYVYNKKRLSAVYLQAHIYGLINCSALAQLPMTMYQEVGSYQVPLDVENRLNNIRSQNAPAYTVNNFKIQKIDDASGGVIGNGRVNCDYYYVKINSLPYQNGVQMTPDQFLEYFRTNINTFISNGVNFQPYSHYTSGVTINESSKVNSPYEASTGGMFHIDMSENGTVVQSGYNRNVTTQHYWFMFTTMKTPVDGTHPVAGNRRFGIFKSGNSYYFYTLGVDRVNDWDVAFANLGNVAFNGGAALWHSVQQGVKSYVNTHQGNSDLVDEKVAQPNWDAFKDFLKGKITLQQYKIQQGCQ